MKLGRVKPWNCPGYTISSAGTFRLSAPRTSAPAVHRNVEVLVPAHEQRRGFDPVRMEKRVPDLDVLLRILPRRPKLVVVLQDVLIDAVEAQRIAIPAPLLAALKRVVLAIV